MGHDVPVTKASGRPADEEQLVRLIGNIVDNERWPGDRVITLGEEQQVVAQRPSRLPLWLGAAAVLVAGAAVAIVLTRPEATRRLSAGQSLLVPSRAARPSPTPVTTATATPRSKQPAPSAYFAEVRPRRSPAPSPPPETLSVNEIDAPLPRPPERAYNPYFAEPLNDEQLGEVLVEDHRRTRELNRQQLDRLRSLERANRLPDD